MNMVQQVLASECSEIISAIFSACYAQVSRRVVSMSRATSGSGSQTEFCEIVNQFNLLSSSLH